nr:hypothetical protein [Rhizobium mongolense]
MDPGAGKDPFFLPRRINRFMGGFDECCANIFERHAVMQALQAHHECLGKVLAVIDLPSLSKRFGARLTELATRLTDGPKGQTVFFHDTLLSV